jgi:hypothetical protein
LMGDVDTLTVPTVLELLATTFFYPEPGFALIPCA